MLLTITQGGYNHYNLPAAKMQGGIDVESREEQKVRTRTYKGKTFLCDENGDIKNQYWLMLVYPESAPDCWRDELGRLGISAVISPLHDKDIDDDGQKKKPHYHVCLCWERGTTTYKRALMWAQRVYPACTHVEPAMSLRSSVRYFFHLDNPEKYQYPISEGYTTTGKDIYDIINSVSDDLLELKYIYHYLSVNKIVRYVDFMEYCSEERPEWARLVNVKYRENVWKYIRSLEHRCKQEASGLTQEAYDSMAQRLQTYSSDLAALRAENERLRKQLKTFQLPDNITFDQLTEAGNP